MKQEFIDLGLPSGTLWARHNVQIRNRKHFTHFEIPLLEDITGYNVPSKEDFEELIHFCKWEWKIIGRTKGYKVTGPNGNHIFLPASGYSYGASLLDAGSHGRYWSTRYSSSDLAYYLFFSSSNKSVYNYSRYCGLSIRLIKRKRV